MKIIHDKEYYRSSTGSTSTVELVEDENGNRFYREVIPVGTAVSDDRFIYYPVLKKEKGTDS